MRPDAFMLICRQGVFAPGESTDQNTDADSDLIEILSFDQEAECEARVDAVDDDGIPTPNHYPIRIVRPVDNASPRIHDYVTKRDRNLAVSLFVRGRSGISTGPSNSWTKPDYLVYEFQDCVVRRVRLVLDPLVHTIAESMLWNTELFDMGPLELIDVDYSQMRYWYGQPQNIAKWREDDE